MRENAGKMGGKGGSHRQPKTKIYYGNFIDNCHCKLTSLALPQLVTKCVAVSGICCICICRIRICASLSIWPHITS